MNYDRRLAELLERVSARDAYEINVLQQVVIMPAAMRDDAYRRAMEGAPPSARASVT